jgi:hypothetical protein
MAFDLAGLLADPRLMDIGTGLLSQSGYSATPITFGQAMGGAMQFANQREADRVGLESARTTLAQQKQRQQAMSEIQGLLQPVNQPYSRVTPGTGPLAQPQSQMGVQSVIPAQTPEGQSKMLGLLSQVAPEAMTQGLLAQMFKEQEPTRVSTDLNTFRALNPSITPGSDAERSGYMAFLQQKEPQAGPEALMQQAELALLVERLEAARMEREGAERTESQDRATTRRNIITDLSHLEEMSDLTDRLEGTFLETGRPAPDVLRAVVGGVQSIQDILGVDSAKAAQIKADYDTLKKYSSDFVLGSLDRLQGTGAIQTSKFDMLTAANAGVGTSPATNRQVIANNIEALLDGADIEGFDLDQNQVKRYRELANRLKGVEAPANPQASELIPAATGAVMPEEAEVDQQIEQLKQQLKALGVTL